MVVHIYHDPIDHSSTLYIIFWRAYPSETLVHRFSYRSRQIRALHHISPDPVMRSDCVISHIIRYIIPHISHFNMSHILNLVTHHSKSNHSMQQTILNLIHSIISMLHYVETNQYN
eukprot:183845_1